MTVEIGTEAARAIPRKGIHKGDFRCSVVCGPEPEVLSDPLLFLFHLLQNFQCHLSIDVSIRVDWIRSPACQEGLLHPLSSASRVTGHVRQQMGAQKLFSFAAEPQLLAYYKGGDLHCHLP
jgi:hypothetical protein